VLRLKENKKGVKKLIFCTFRQHYFNHKQYLMKSLIPSFTVLIILFFLSFLNLNGQVLRDSTYTKEEIIEDLDVFKKALEAVHPALYEFQTATEFDALFEAAKSRVKEEMTDWDMLNLMGPIVQAIGCGHTTIRKVNTKREVKLMKKRKVFSLDTVNTLPFKGIFIENRLFIGATYDTTLDKTMEVLSIDGHTTKELLAKVRKYPTFSNDGKRTRLIDYLAQKGILEAVYWYYFPTKNSIKLAIKKDGQVDYLKIPTFAYNDPKKIVEDQIENKDTVWEKKVIEKKAHKAKSIHLFQHKNQKELCLLEVKGFDSNTKKRLTKVFDYLDNNQTKNLILDLRGNLGGDIKTVINLLSYTLNKTHRFVMQSRKIPKNIKKSRYKAFFLAPFIRSIFVTSFYKKRRVNGETILSKTIKPKTTHHYKGNLYVLTDGGSFSGSSILASIIKNEDRAIFLGTETSGAKDVTNGATYFYPKSPNSRCSIRIPRYRINHQVKNPNKGRGVIPRRRFGDGKSFRSDK